MPEIILEDKKNTIPSLLTTLVYEENLARKLNAVDTLISALDPEVAELTGAIKFKNWLNQNYMSDVNFMRQLKMYTSLVNTPETAMEYFGQDFLTHQEYMFDENFERVIIKINRVINHFVGRLLRELTKVESVNI